MSLSLEKPTRRVKAPKRIVRKCRPRKRRRGTKAAMAREADRLWSAMVRMRGACEMGGEHSGPLQGAHCFSRRYRNTRWLLINGVCLCAGHHVAMTHDPLAWDDWLRLTWGEGVYLELKRLAQKSTPPDVVEALAKLRAEAATLGIR